MNVIGIVKTVHAVDPAVVLMEPVVLQFIGHIDQDKKEAGNPDGQTHNIQNRVVEFLGGFF